MISKPTKNLTDAQQQEFIVAAFMQFTNPMISEFLGRHKIKKSGNKEQLEARVVQNLDSKKLKLSDITGFINVASLWRRQHVFLFDAPSSITQTFSNRARFENHLKKKGFGSLLDSQLPAVLPDEMKLVSIEHNVDKIRITAVVRTTHRKREKELDELEDTVVSKSHIDKFGAAVFVEKRAFRIRIARTVVSLEWSLKTNSPSFGMLQISEMPSGNDYAEIRDQFLELAKDIVPLGDFVPCNMDNVVGNIHDAEDSSVDPETRSHRFDYLAQSGGRISGRSSAADASICNDQDIAPLVTNARSSGGSGEFANVYFLNDGGTIDSDLHVYIYAEQSKIRIARHCTEEEVRHVISRIRHFAA